MISCCSLCSSVSLAMGCVLAKVRQWRIPSSVVTLYSFWSCVYLEAGNGAVCGRNAPREFLLQLMQLCLCGCGLPPCRGLIMAQGLVLILQRLVDDCERGYLAF